MTTPLLMLFLLTAPLAVAHVWSVASGRGAPYRRAAVVGLAVLFTFTGIGHFAQTATMAQMLPPWMPARVPLVWATGVLELVVAAAFLAPRWQRLAGWAALAMLIGFFPANIYAAFQHVPMGGHAWGPAYLWIRAPLQLILLLWVYWFALRPFNSGRGVDRAAGRSRQLDATAG